jgi:hypothetical protein
MTTAAKVKSSEARGAHLTALDMMDMIFFMLLDMAPSILYRI